MIGTLEFSLIRLAIVLPNGLTLVFPAVAGKAVADARALSLYVIKALNTYRGSA